MIIATSLGIGINDFWDITPKELSLTVKGYAKRKEAEAEEYQIKLQNQQQLMAIQAYWISRWVWAKKLDIKGVLKELQEDHKRKEEMTDEQMLEQVKRLTYMLGGEVQIYSEE